MRLKLPQRRQAITEEFTTVEGWQLTATIGFDEEGAPREIFLSGAKDGSGIAALLADASVIISVALQHRVPASVMAKSVGRIPTEIDGPAIKPLTVLGEALALIAAHENE